jgi:hypothetical protein
MRELLRRLGPLKSRPVAGLTVKGAVCPEDPAFPLAQAVNGWGGRISFRKCFLSRVLLFSDEQLMGIWWRGEAVGDKPIAPNKTADHDIGDGMYLADTKESAVEYTIQRTDDPKSRRLYSVRLDLSQMRVLDLTQDPRWLKDIKMVEPSIRAANVNYGRVFQNFLKANKINLDDFDAVIGIDYLKGGKQICILYKDGQVTRLQSQIRATFVPESIGTEPPMDSTSISKRLQTSGVGELGEGLTIVGFGLLEIAMMFFGAWLREKGENSLVKKQFKDLGPKINAEIKKHSAMIALLQSKGKKAYANITISVDQQTDYVSEVGQISDFAVIRLKGVFVGPDNVNLQQGTETTYGLGASVKSTQYTYSAEVSLSKDEIALFNALMVEYQYFDTVVKLDPTNPVFQRGLAVVRQQITNSFGEYAAHDVLDAWMWPTFKYQGTPMGERN